MLIPPNRFKARQIPLTLSSCFRSLGLQGHLLIPLLPDKLILLSILVSTVEVWKGFQQRRTQAQCHLK